MEVIMTCNIDERAYELIRFVQHLHDMNSDRYGLVNTVERNRCKRWMDAVLPLPNNPDRDVDIYFLDKDVLEGLKKAAG
jgi:hypothetical protein